MKLQAHAIEVAEFIDRVLPDRSGLTCEDAVDLNQVASVLGAKDIRYSATKMHGFTDWSGHHPVIYLSYAKTDGRRRFTLGHECGHILLENHSSLFPRAIKRQSAEDPEIVCDWIAAELLIPATEASSLLENTDDLSDIYRQAKRFRVSTSMLVTRLRTFGGSQIMLKLQKTSHGRWVVTQRAGVNTEWKGTLRLLPESEALLSGIDTSRDTAQAQLDFQLRQTRVRVTADIRRYEDDAVLLINQNTGIRPIRHMPAA